MANIHYLALEWDPWLIGSIICNILKCEFSDINREGRLATGLNDHPYKIYRQRSLFDTNTDNVLFSLQNN